MTDLEKKTAIIELLENLDDSDMVSIHNEYCYSNDYYDDTILYMCDFDDMYSHLKPSEIVDKFGSMNTNDNYFFEGIYGAESFDYYSDCPTTFYEEIAECALDNDEDFNNRELRELLDELCN